MRRPVLHILAFIPLLVFSVGCFGSSPGGGSASQYGAAPFTTADGIEDGPGAASGATLRARRDAAQPLRVRGDHHRGGRPGTGAAHHPPYRRTAAARAASAERRPHRRPEPPGVERGAAGARGDPAGEKRGGAIELPDGTLRRARATSSLDPQPRDRCLYRAGRHAGRQRGRADHPHAADDPAVLTSRRSLQAPGIRHHLYRCRARSGRVLSIAPGDIGDVHGGVQRLGLHIHGRIERARALLASVETTVARRALELKA